MDLHLDGGSDTTRDTIKVAVDGHVVKAECVKLVAQLHFRSTRHDEALERVGLTQRLLIFALTRELRDSKGARLKSDPIKQKRRDDSSRPGSVSHVATRHVIRKLGVLR